MDTDIPCYGGSDYNGCPYGDFCFQTYGNVQSFQKILMNNIFYQVN